MIRILILCLCFFLNAFGADQENIRPNGGRYYGIKLPPLEKKKSPEANRTEVQIYEKEASLLPPLRDQECKTKAVLKLQPLVLINAGGTKDLSDSVGDMLLRSRWASELLSSSELLIMMPLHFN